jgi:hypothetical protein
MSKLSKAKRAAARRLPLAVARGYTQIAAESIDLYRKTTRTWKHQPDFYAERTARGVTINTDSAIYGYVDRGTRAHIIRAKRAPFLVFRYPYKAATKPRVIGSTKAQYGKFWARKIEVHHPGTKPRHFTDEIARRMQRRAANIMRKHIKEALSVEAVGL